MISIGIDPGSGVKSATGVCILDMKTGTIIAHTEIWPVNKSAKAYQRARSITNQFLEFLAACEVLKGMKLEGKMVTEAFVMRGKGGETLQRLIGALHICVPDKVRVEEVSNVRVKQFLSITGRGDASKEDVAKGVISWFTARGLETEVELVQDALKHKQFDFVDACALGIIGVLNQ